MPHDTLKDKNCLITGATGGIGTCIAREMARQGCNLFLTSTNAERLGELGLDIAQNINREIAVNFKAVDLNRADQYEALLKSVRKVMTHVDIFIHSAGVFVVEPLYETSLNDYDQSFNVNVKSAFFLSRAFASDMVARRWGRIVLIGSSSAYGGAPNTAVYCAAKHALLGLARALQAELKGSNVRTLCISPAGTKTAMGRRIENQDYDTFLDPTEIAAWVAFACSFDGALTTDELRLNRMDTLQ